MRSDYTTKSRSNQITQIELVLPTFKSWTVHKIIGYLTLGLLSSLGNIYHSTTGYFLTHAVFAGGLIASARGE